MGITQALICLLAGKSQRMGSPKQHLVLRGKIFLDHILGTIAVFSETIKIRVFVGTPEDLLSKEIIQNAGGIWVENPLTELGPLHSVRLALKEIPISCGFFIWPVDHPLVKQTTVSTLLRAVQETPEMLVIPSMQNRRGHPAYFPAWTREALNESPLESGAKSVLQKFPDRIRHVIVDDIWVLRNLNTPDRYEEAENKDER